MGEVGIWIGLVVAGLAALGLIEFLRSNGAVTARWSGIKDAILAVIVLTLTLVAGVLAISFIIVVFLWEIWEYVLIGCLILGALWGLKGWKSGRRF